MQREFDVYLFLDSTNMFDRGGTHKDDSRREASQRTDSVLVHPALGTINRVNYRKQHPDVVFLQPAVVPLRDIFADWKG